MTAVMGYDPGVKGGLAVVGGLFPWVIGFDSKMTENDVLAIVKDGVSVLVENKGDTCYVEKVHHIRGDGGKGSFTFGGIYRLVRGMLLMANVKLVSVSPQIWQAYMGCMTGGDKKVTRDKAAETFPSLNIKGMAIKDADKISDALLIAEFGRRRTVYNSGV